MCVIRKRCWKSVRFCNLENSYFGIFLIFWWIFFVCIFSKICISIGFSVTMVYWFTMAFKLGLCGFESSVYGPTPWTRGSWCADNSQQVAPHQTRHGARRDVKLESRERRTKGRNFNGRHLLPTNNTQLVCWFMGRLLQSAVNLAAAPFRAFVPLHSKPPKRPSSKTINGLQQ